MFLTSKYDFIPQLKDHILACYNNMPYGDKEHMFLDAEYNGVVFIGNCMYKHKAICINFTAYEMHCM